MRERNHFIGLWLNDEEYAHLREQSEMTGLPASVLIRHTIAGLQLRHRPPDEYAALLRVLSAIGNNVNQIAHWANAKKSIQEAEIRQAVLLANKAWELIKEKLYMCLTVRQVSVRFAFISRADILFFWKGLAIII